MWDVLKISKGPACLLLDLLVCPLADWKFVGMTRAYKSLEETCYQGKIGGIGEDNEDEEDAGGWAKGEKEGNKENT